MCRGGQSFIKNKPKKKKKERCSLWAQRMELSRHVSGSEAGDGFAKVDLRKWPGPGGISPMTGEGTGPGILLCSAMPVPRPWLPCPARFPQQSQTVVNTGSFQSPQDG